VLNHSDSISRHHTFVNETFAEGFLFQTQGRCGRRRSSCESGNDDSLQLHPCTAPAPAVAPLHACSCTPARPLRRAFPALATAIPRPQHVGSAHAEPPAALGWARATPLPSLLRALRPAAVLSFRAQRLAARCADGPHALQRTAPRAVSGWRGRRRGRCLGPRGRTVSVSDSVSDPVEVTLLLVNFVVSCNIFISSSWFNSSDLPLGF